MLGAGEGAALISNKKNNKTIIADRHWDVFAKHKQKRNRKWDIFRRNG